MTAGAEGDDGAAQSIFKNHQGHRVGAPKVCGTRAAANGRKPPGTRTERFKERAQGCQAKSYIASIVRKAKGAPILRSTPLPPIVSAKTQAKRMRAVVLRLRRMAKPVAPKPISIMAQVAGSGTAPVAFSSVNANCAGVALNPPPPF